MQFNRAFSRAFLLSLRRRRAAVTLTHAQCIRSLTSSLYVAVLPHQIILMLWWINTTNHHYSFNLLHKQRYGGGRGWDSSHARVFVWSQSSCTCSIWQSCYYGFIWAYFISLMCLGSFPHVFLTCLCNTDRNTPVKSDLRDISVRPLRASVSIVFFLILLWLINTTEHLIQCIS